MQAAPACTICCARILPAQSTKLYLDHHLAVLHRPTEGTGVTRIKHRQSKYIGVGISVGAGIGAAIGVIADNIPMGIALGIALGIAVGALVGRRGSRA